MATNSFLASTGEKLTLNQYWYSTHSINQMVDEIELFSKRCAFLSTPSIFFSLKDQTLKQNSALFDFDDQWADLPQFVKYDFHAPSAIPSSHHHQYDYVVIDPPFITKEVWELYAQAARLLLIPTPGIHQEDITVNAATQSNGQEHVGGRILLTTIPESAPFLQEMLNVRSQNWRPSIPNLIYQYSIYCNYQSNNLSKFNPEIDPELASKHNQSIEQASSQSSQTSDESFQQPAIENMSDSFTARKACSYEGFGSDSINTAN